MPDADSHVLINADLVEKDGFRPGRIQEDVVSRYVEAQRLNWLELVSWGSVVLTRCVREYTTQVAK